MENAKAGASKVYVVQDPKRVNKDGYLVNKFDLSPAKEFGELVILLSANAKPFSPAPIIAELKEKLKFFNDNDFLLAAGNPLLMCWAMALAAEVNNGQVCMLQWNGKRQYYTKVVAKLWEDAVIRY